MSSPAAPTGLINPLASDRRASPFVTFGFGSLTHDPKVLELADRLEAKLALALGDLPPSMATEAAGELKTYAARRPRFIDLFYVPIWSFLHWVPAGRPSESVDRILEQAVEAQALSLFLHLWDDHLSDGQLKPNMMRLHLRAIAWERYHAAVRALAREVPDGDAIVTRLLHGYLNACHQRNPVADAASFYDRFVQQIGIVLVVPTLLGHLAGGPNMARDLGEIIVSFAVAWRMIDDVRDVHKDIVSGQQNAVWFELDADGRSAWNTCHAASVRQASLETKTWFMALVAIGGGPVQSVLRQIIARLAKAQALAEGAGWTGLAAELVSCGALSGLEEARLSL